MNAASGSIGTTDPAPPPPPARAAVLKPAGLRSAGPTIVQKEWAAPRERAALFAAPAGGRGRCRVLPGGTSPPP